MDSEPDKTMLVPRSGGAARDLFHPGDVVGQYKVERVLGKGGMGVVYLVQHTALRKHFALKALPAALAQEKSFVERFKREATMLARLKHNHIVNVTDFGESQGKLYLVLEYVDGGTIEDWFEKNRKPGGGARVDDVQRMVGQILLGLTHAHETGVIHRDLKPANVLLEKSGDAKISDFGLARVVAEEEYRRTGGTAAPFQGDSVTTTGALVGTIDFMSPEARNMHPSDHRSDIYAVGVITYYLLTGKKPSGFAKLASQLVPGLDPKWDKFIATCLAEDPGKRFQTAKAAGESLRQIQQTRGGNRRLVPAAVVAVVVMAGIGLWQWRKPAPPPATTPVVAAPAPEPVVKKEEPLAPAKPEVKPASPVVQAVVPVARKFALTGLPEGAIVTHNERNHPANAAGRVVLELPPGPQVVRVKAVGYVDWEGEVGGSEGATEEAIPLQLVPPHPVHFTGLPAGTQLRIADQTATADTAGVATLELRPGRVTVTATAPKYETLESTAEIQPATDTVALAMKRLPPPAEVVVTLADGTAMKFRWVPPGSFFLGSPPDERGRQRNDLARSKTEIPRGFYLAETETTQRQHRGLTGRNPSNSRALGDETRPVEQVGWRELTGPAGAIEKLNDNLRRLGLPYHADLPTEVEWEYAGRAGTDTAFNDGSNLTNERDDPALNALATYSRGSALDGPTPVAKRKPNAWGLFDIQGNVAEWTYGIRGKREPVLRGGSWKAGAVHCRVASRVEATPEVRPTDAMGYRLMLRPLED